MKGKLYRDLLLSAGIGGGIGAITGEDVRSGLGGAIGGGALGVMASLGKGKGRDVVGKRALGKLSRDVNEDILEGLADFVERSGGKLNATEFGFPSNKAGSKFRKGVPIKEQRIFEKVVGENYPEGKGVGEIRDVVRMATGVNSPEETKSLLQGLMSGKKNGYSIERVKPLVSDEGYMDLKVNVRTPNGVIGELLIGDGDVLSAKMKGGFGSLEVEDRFLEGIKGKKLDSKIRGDLERLSGEGLYRIVRSNKYSSDMRKLANEISVAKYGKITNKNKEMAKFIKEFKAYKNPNIRPNKYESGILLDLLKDNSVSRNVLAGGGGGMIIGGLLKDKK